MTLLVRGPLFGKALREDNLLAPDLATAIRLATERAFERIAEDVEAHCFNPNSCIIIEDETGKIVHVIRFGDLLDAVGKAAN